VPTDDEKLEVLAGLAMFRGEDEDEDEDGPAPRLPGGARPVVNAEARRLIQEAHEDGPTAHEVPSDPAMASDGPPERGGALPGQATGRADIAQAARAWGASDADSRSACARLRARLRGMIERGDEASKLMQDFLIELVAAGASRGVVDSFRERVDEWDERRTDVLVS
jgi:hypothetical protein